jgi:hypothetical protein
MPSVPANTSATPAPVSAPASIKPPAAGRKNRLPQLNTEQPAYALVITYLLITGAGWPRLRRRLWLSLTTSDAVAPAATIDPRIFMIPLSAAGTC